MSFEYGDGLRLELIESLDDAREDWIRLAEGAGHPFATWEWNSSWWRWFAGGRRLYSFVCRDETGEAVAILPLYEAVQRPVRIARFLGYGELGSPVCGPEAIEAAASGLWMAIRRGRGNPRIVLAEQLPGDRGWGEALGGRLVSDGHDPLVRFDGRPWEEVIGDWKSKLRGNLRRREAKLVEKHGLTFRLADDSARLGEDLDALYRLHEARWGEEATGVFEGDRGAFHRDFAEAAQKRGWLRLWLAEIDGETVGAWYGWRYANAEWYFQAGRDPRFDKAGLGTVMLVQAMRSACEDGVAVFHFLGGEQVEQFKDRFANGDAGSETRLLASGLSGRLAGMALARSDSLPGPVRRRLTRASA
jgi:CelD/BcsL family acetyltransferase involved in cellulose biosynthesis